MKLPDLYLWLNLLPVTLSTVLPTALFTGLLCWLVWGRRLAALKREQGYFAEPGLSSPPPASPREATVGKEDSLASADPEVGGLKAALAEARQSREEALALAGRAKERLKKVTAELQAAKQIQVERDAQFEREQEAHLAREREAQLEEAAEPSREEPGAALEEAPLEAEAPEEIEDGETSSAEEVAELTEALRESEYEVSRLHTEIQLLQTIRAEFDALRNDNDDLEERVASLSQENVALESLVQQVGGEKAQLEDVVNALRVDKLDLGAAIEELKAENETLQHALSGVLEEKARLEERLEVLAASEELPEDGDLANEEGEAVEGETDGDLPEEVAEPALSFGQVERPQRVDALTKIEGLPDSLEAKLNALGIYQFSQIAKWTPEQVATVSERLGFQDRIVRDRWIEQAIDLEGESDSEVTGAAKASPAGDEKGEAGHAAAAPGPDEGGEEVDAGQSLLFFDLEAADGHAGEGESAAGLKDPSEEGKRDEGDAPGEEETDALRPEEGQTGGAVRPEAVEDAEDPDTHLLFNDPEMGPVFRRPPSRIDDLTRIKGVARVIEGRLHEMGIFRYQQIAEWSEAQVASVSKRLRFRERIARDQWQAQCRDLLGMTGKPSEERDTA